MRGRAPAVVVLLSATLLTGCAGDGGERPSARRTPGCDLASAASVRAVIGALPQRREDSSGNVATSFLECAWFGGAGRPSLTVHVEQDSQGPRRRFAPPRGCRDAGVTGMSGYVCPEPDSLSAARAVARLDGHDVSLRVGQADALPGRAQLVAGMRAVLRDVGMRLDDGDFRRAGS